jgi:hypothetical protein
VGSGDADFVTAWCECASDGVDHAVGGWWAASEHGFVVFVDDGDLDGFSCVECDVCGDGKRLSAHD